MHVTIYNDTSTKPKTKHQKKMKYEAKIYHKLR